jgi:hypothetical protein
LNDQDLCGFLVERKLRQALEIVIADLKAEVDGDPELAIEGLPIEGLPLLRASLSGREH